MSLSGPVPFRSVLHSVLQPVSQYQLISLCAEKLPLLWVDLVRFPVSGEDYYLPADIGNVLIRDKPLVSSHEEAVVIMTENPKIYVEVAMQNKDYHKKVKIVYTTGKNASLTAFGEDLFISVHIMPHKAKLSHSRVLH